MNESHFRNDSKREILLFKLFDLFPKKPTLNIYGALYNCIELLTISRMGSQNELNRTFVGNTRGSYRG